MTDDAALRCLISLVSQAGHAALLEADEAAGYLGRRRTSEGWGPDHPLVQSLWSAAAATHSVTSREFILSALLEPRTLSPLELVRGVRRLAGHPESLMQIVRHPSATGEVWRAAAAMGRGGLLWDALAGIEAARVDAVVRPVLLRQRRTPRLPLHEALLSEADGVEFRALLLELLQESPARALALMSGARPEQVASLMASDLTSLLLSAHPDQREDGLTLLQGTSQAN